MPSLFKILKLLVVQRIMIFTLSFTLLGFCSAYGQLASSPLASKNWYAIKIFSGEPGESNKHMDFLCEQDCNGTDRLYYFKLEIKSDFAVKVWDRSNKIRKDYYKVLIFSDKLQLLYGPTVKENDEFEIKEQSEDFLIIKKKRDIFYLISDHQRISGVEVN